MSVTEILQELDHLSPEEQDLVIKRLDELQAEHIEETPETLNAIDEARQSIREGRSHSIEEARLLIKQKVELASARFFYIHT